MGKQGNWFATVRKALTPDSKRGNKLKKKWLKKHKNVDRVGSSKGIDPPTSPPSAAAADPPPPPPPPPPLSKGKLEEVGEEESRQAYSVALATAAAAKAAVVAADAAADVIRLTNATRVSGKLKHEIAAIKIQTTFRGYLSRKALRAMRGLSRLKALIQGPSVKRQSTTTLHRLQMLSRVQSQIRMQRVRKSEENQASQRQVQQKHDKTRPCMGGDWNLSVKSKAEVEAKQQYRQEAAMRREKALAYAFSRQQAWKNSLKPQNQPVLDPNNPHRGWSWLERSMEGRSWESQSTIDYNKKESSAKSRPISTGENKREAHPPVKPAPKPSSSSVTWKMKTNTTTNTKGKQEKPKPKPKPRGRGRGRGRGDDDTRSMSSVQSEAKENEKPENVPNYMTATEATAAKSRGISPKREILKRRVPASAKRLSFPPANAPADHRRLSSPPIKWVLPP